MIETRYYCDRCGREVLDVGPLNFPMERFKTYVLHAKVTFGKKICSEETTKMICEDCLESLNNWYNEGKKHER